MTIKELKRNRILPFEVGDESLHNLFSFFLHSAPTIESKTAAIISPEKLLENWKVYIEDWKQNQYRFYSSNSKFPDSKILDDFGISDISKISRKSHAFVCKYKSSSESDYECVLRHIRNAIAHSNVFLKNAGNRKYILLEDYNKNNNKTAILLFSQSDLKRLKKYIMF